MLRYGSMRAQVLGIEAVLADGTVIRRMSGLRKDNTGYDLPGLLTGFEGTLAIVTAARLRLVPRQERRAVAVLAVATDRPGREQLWQLRERHTEAINAAGVPHKLDVALPLGALPRFEGRARTLVADLAPAARLILFGHLGDGNLHVNVLGLAPDDDRVDEAVLRLVAELGRSIGAEHGIGTAKARWLPLTRGPADIAAMRAVKHALDPRGLLNPGVLLPLRPQAGTR